MDHYIREKQTEQGSVIKESMLKKQIAFFKKITTTHNHLFINYLILAYALVIPLSAQVSRCIAVSMLVLCLFEGGWKQKILAIKKEFLIKALFLLIAVLSLSLLWTQSENLHIGIRYITRFWYLLPLLVIYLFLEKKMIPYLFSAFLLGMFISEVASYGIFFELIHIPKKSPINPAPFMHHTIYSVFLVTAIGILLNKLLNNSKIAYRVFGGIFFLTMTANLFINAGRTGQILFFLVVSYVVLDNFKLTFRSIISVILLICVVPLLAFYYSPNFKNRMIEGYNDLTQLTNYNTSLGARAGLYLISKEIIQGAPLLGVGAGDYLEEKQVIVEQKLPTWDYLRRLHHFHNQYIEFFIIAGILGFSAYLLILIALMSLSIREHEIKQIKFIILITFTLTSLIDQTFHTYQGLSLFALFVGTILATKRIENTPISNRVAIQ